ncbi:hypothetical protein GCM10009745_13270 [Kribbella yunnanensis]|uniref:Uncharacterized protein n=1 Tax=Kribbella yunnanensis TaxID=190194 RepID=A0ABN2GJC0_9ACTN
MGSKVSRLFGSSRRPAVSALALSLAVGGTLVAVAGGPPATAEQAYRTAARKTGNDSLLRQAYVDAPGHCNFTPGEVLASVETIIARIETNRWPYTAPKPGAGYN